LPIKSIIVVVVFKVCFVKKNWVIFFIILYLIFEIITYTRGFFYILDKSEFNFFILLFKKYKETISLSKIHLNIFMNNILYTHMA
jgi:hypothetical protein